VKKTGCFGRNSI